MKQFGLGKHHKLCSPVAIGRLFTDGTTQKALAYPLRALWRDSSGRRDSDAFYRFVITVPKKRVRRAVDRVAVRRRIREAYRLNHSATEPAEPSAKDIAFVYVANDVLPSAIVHNAMQRLLYKIHQQPSAGHESAKTDKLADQ